MNWLTVADWCKAHSCYEAQRYDRCGCNTRGKNPCRHARNMHDIAESLDGIDPAAFPDDVLSVLRFVKSKTCGTSRAGRPCPHRGCVNAEAIIRWLEVQLPVNNFADPRTTQRPFTQSKKRLAQHA